MHFSTRQLKNSKKETSYILCNTTVIYPFLLLATEMRFIRIHTSSITGDSLANWEEDEEWGSNGPVVNEPFPKPVAKREMGPEPLHASACRGKFC